MFSFRDEIRKYPISVGSLIFEISDLFPQGVPPYFILFCQPQKVWTGDFSRSSQRYYVPGGKKEDGTSNMKTFDFYLNSMPFECYSSNFAREGNDRMMYW